MDKNKNIRYFRRVTRFKKLFLGMIILAERLRITHAIAPVFNRFLKFIGIPKNVYTYSNYRRFGKSFQNAFHDKKAAKDKVLFPMMFGNNSNFNLLNLLLAKHLETKGLHPVFLVCNSAFSICGRERTGKTRKGTPLFCYECYGGYKSLQKETGIDLIFMKDQLSEETMNQYEKEGKIINTLKTPDDCLNYRMEKGFKLGLATKKRILRYFYSSKLTDSPEELKIYKNFLREGVLYYLLMDAWFEKKPEFKHIVLHNGTLAFGSYLFEISSRRNINLVTYETYLGNNSIIYKKNDEVMKLDWEEEMQVYYKNHTLTPENKTLAQNFFHGLQQGKDMYTVLNKEHNFAKLGNIKDYVCLFTNLNFDTAVLDRNTIFSSMEEWIYELIKFWEENVAHTTLVIRIHPAEIKLKTPSSDFLADKLKARIRKSNILLIDPLDEVNSYRLIGGMKFGLVYASTIALEAMHAGKPVIIAGDPFYRNQPFALAPENKKDYFHLLEKYLTHEVHPFKEYEALYRFVYYLYFVRVKKFKGFYIQYRGHVENHDIPDYATLLRENKDILEDFYDECFS